jgi:glycerone phosphate O-acyltransferase
MSNVVSMVSDQYSSNMASDLNFVYSASGEFSKRPGPSRQELMATVLGSHLVQNEIQREAQRKSLTHLEVEQRAKSIMDRMFADPSPRTVRGLSWMLRKVWRQMYQSVIIESDQILLLKQIATMGQESTLNPSMQIGHIDGFDASQMTVPPGPLVFIPTHRSYMDFLILSYIFFAYSIPVPHIAAGEDFLNMTVVRNLFRHSGAFFIRRQFGTDQLYKSIFTMYVQHLLMDGCPMEFFVEGTRSRSGKTLQPKLGLLSIIIDSFLERKVPNLTIVPVNISYERLIEGQAYSSELLGEAKKKESLQNLVKARNVLSNRYGDIHVKIAPPISLVDYVKQLQRDNAHINDSNVQHDDTECPDRGETQKEQDPNERSFDPFLNNSDRKTLVRRLAYKITHELNASSVLPATALVAAIVLAYRDGISLDELNLRTAWLRRLIVERGGRLSWVAGDLRAGSSVRHSQQNFSTSAVVDRALSLMSDVVVKRKFMIEPAVNSREQHKRFIQLGVYRNQIIHLFVQESIMACAYEQQAALWERDVSRARIAPSDTLLPHHLQAEARVPVDKLLDSARFLSRLMKFEFVRQENPDEKEDWERVLQTMVSRGIFTQDNDVLILPLKSIEIHRFLCSLLWPFIESYWATTMALLSLLFTGSEKEQLNSVEENVLIQRIQWLAEKLFFEGKVHFYECCSLETIKNAVSTFVSWQVLARTVKEEQGENKKKKKNKDGETNTITSVHLLPPLCNRNRYWFNNCC